jgi:hypothetical protein
MHALNNDSSNVQRIWRWKTVIEDEDWEEDTDDDEDDEDEEW